MQNLGGRARIAVVFAMLCTWALLAYACSSADENPGSTRTRDSGVTGEGGVDPQGTGDSSLGPAICGKYGGYNNVKVISAAIIARVAGDCRISAPIANLNPEQTAHLAECFQIQMGGAFQCDGISYVSNTTTDSKGQHCRDMTQAHKGLNLRSADFNAFVEDIAAELAAKGVTPDDIRSLAPAFEGTRTGVVQTNNQPDKNTFCTCAGGQYMGKPCLPEAGVDASDSGSDASDAADAGDSG